MIFAVDVRPAQTTVAIPDANRRFLSQEIMATSDDPSNG
jgi:hypothetical protein